jgi:hypothetical protein
MTPEAAALFVQRVYKGHKVRRAVMHWIRVVDDDGDIFFHNPRSGETLWELPAIPFELSVPAPPPAQAQAAAAARRDPERNDAELHLAATELVRSVSRGAGSPPKLPPSSSAFYRPSSTSPSIHNQQHQYHPHHGLVPGPIPLAPSALQPSSSPSSASASASVLVPAPAPVPLPLVAWDVHTDPGGRRLMDGWVRAREGSEEWYFNSGTGESSWEPVLAET